MEVLPIQDWGDIKSLVPQGVTSLQLRIIIGVSPSDVVHRASGVQPAGRLRRAQDIQSCSRTAVAGEEPESVVGFIHTSESQRFG